MRYNINARLIYNATDGTLSLPGEDEADSQLSITSSALLCFFLHHTGIVSRDEVLKKVWDDNGLTSSNSNLNQYLSMLRKTFRHYDIDNIIVTVSRGHLQLNPDMVIGMLDANREPVSEMDLRQTSLHKSDAVRSENKQKPASTLHSRGICWYLTGLCLLTFALLLVTFSFLAEKESRPIALTRINHSQCELLASDEMLRSVAKTAYVRNFDAVRQRLKLPCKQGERFVFFYGDRLETNGLGRVFLAHCVMHEDNPFSYCDNYFYYSWRLQ